MRRALCVLAVVAPAAPFVAPRASPPPRLRPARLAPADALAAAAPAVDLPSTLAVAAASDAFAATADELAGSLFGFSLLPWLAMLYWLKHPKSGAPEGVTFGLTYLLAFVFGSIPAAIGAGALYGASLADADWLHGAAESLLAATNCVVVLGFRDALGGGGDAGRLRAAGGAWAGVAAATALAVACGGDVAASQHAAWLGGVGNLPLDLAEPPNALSAPTWAIHTSSLVEWLVAMGLAWRYAEASATPAWRGVTWGMLPLHTSGIVACCYHLFYNAPDLAWCVALQAGCTCLGNTTLAFACYRLAASRGWTWADGGADAAAAWAALAGGGGGGGGGPEAAGVAAAAGPAAAAAGGAGAALLGWEDLGDAWAGDGDGAFLAKLAALSLALAYAAKYGPPLVVSSDAAASWAAQPPAVHSAAAAAVIVVPTLLNVAKWRQRSGADTDFAGDF
jgi:hypothetical protein